MNVLELIPQRPPFVMIGSYLHINDEDGESTLPITRQNVFCQCGIFQAEGLIEHVAQSCAARIGYMNLAKGEGIKIGYIGSIKDFHIYRLPQAEETLHTFLHVEKEIFDVTLVTARVTSNSEVLAEGQMKIVLTPTTSKANE